MRGVRIAAVLLAGLAIAGCTSPPEPDAGDPDAEGRRTRVLLIEERPRWEYRYLKNALLRDDSLLVDVLLVSADADFPQECSPGRSPLTFLPLQRTELAQYDVIIVGDVSPMSLETPELSPAQSLQNLSDWVEDGGGLILIAGEQYMPVAWRVTALESLLPIGYAWPLPEDTGDYSYRLTDFGKRSAITSFAADPASPSEAWEDLDGRGDGLRAVRWIIGSRSKPGSHVLVECGPEGGRRPLFVTRETGRGRVFFSATDETWRWRFVCGDAPWFYPFWKSVIDWASGGE